MHADGTPPWFEEAFVQTGPDLVPALTRILDDRDPAVRRRAVQEIPETRSPAGDSPQSDNRLYESHPFVRSCTMRNRNAWSMTRIVASIFWLTCIPSLCLADESEGMVAHDVYFTLADRFRCSFYRGQSPRCLLRKDRRVLD